MLTFVLLKCSVIPCTVVALENCLEIRFLLCLCLQHLLKWYGLNIRPLFSMFRCEGLEYDLFSINMQHVFIYVRFKIQRMHCKWGAGESNINVWFPFMYSQKWNCAGYIQNIITMFFLPIPTLCERFIYFQDRPVYFAAKYVEVNRSWEYINRSQTHECGNCVWKGIHKWNFRCSVLIPNGTH